MSELPEIIGNVLDIRGPKLTMVRYPIVGLARDGRGNGRYRGPAISYTLAEWRELARAILAVPETGKEGAP